MYWTDYFPPSIHLSLYQIWLYWSLVIGVRVLVFNTTFNNISVISWWPVLLVKETGVPVEKHRPVASHWQILSLNVVSNTPCLSGIWTRSVSGDSTDCTGSYISNYHTITTTTAPMFGYSEKITWPLKYHSMWTRLYHVLLFSSNYDIYICINCFFYRTTSFTQR